MDLVVHFPIHFLSPGICKHREFIIEVTSYMISIQNLSNYMLCVPVMNLTHYILFVQTIIRIIVYINWCTIMYPTYMHLTADMNQCRRKSTDLFLSRGVWKTHNACIEQLISHHVCYMSKGCNFMCETSQVTFQTYKMARLIMYVFLCRFNNIPEKIHVNRSNNDLYLVDSTQLLLYVILIF